MTYILVLISAKKVQEGRQTFKEKLYRYLKQGNVYKKSGIIF